MRLRARRNTGWAVWLSVVALGLNALVPIHAAFDFAEALGADAAEIKHGLEWRILALTCGHDEPSGKPDDGDRHHRHSAECAVCSAAGALAGLVWAGAAVLPAPFAIDAPALSAALLGQSDRRFAAAYLSRAPPLA